VGFAARPFGGLVFGHFGDRLGRKSMLVITLVVMGIATFLIGLVPTYDQIGVWAPILLVLLRVVQGFAVGGEWGGGVLLVSEHAPKKRRGFYSAWSQTGVGLGFVLSALVYSTVTSMTGEDEFLAWGWRIPFLIGIVLTAVGLLIRVRILETPAFEKVKASHQEAKLPIIEAIRTHPRAILITMGARVAENGASYIFLVFALTYATTVGLDRQVVLNAVLLASAVEVLAMPAFGALSDRIGRRPVYLGGAVALILWAFPFFALIDSGESALVFLAVFVAIVICHGAMIGTQPSFFTELFGSRVRYSGVAIGHELASVFAGGLSPLIATALLAWAGASWPVALFLIGLGVITTVSVLLAPETSQRDVVVTDDAVAAEATRA
jgi:MFS transporter, MHS family, shikimate and dehydroshikimate transport protein